MATITDKITDDQLKIHIHHIGGIGGYGPTGALLQIPDTQWIVYDANKKALPMTSKSPGNIKLINKCIGKLNGKTKFYITTAPSASSMLKPSSKAINYTVLNKDGTAQIWGEHTKPIQTINIKTETLDSLLKEHQIPQIDFLSSDAQGAELDIIQGGRNEIQKTTIGIICETDFSELYQNQALFSDIHTYLNKNNFVLTQIYNHQYFNVAPYPKQLQGRGIHTVGESLFLKDPQAILKRIKKNSPSLLEDIIKLLKLAIIALIYDQLDLTVYILQELSQKKIISLPELASKTNTTYIKLLNEILSISNTMLENNPKPIYQSTNLNDRNQKIKKKQKSRIDEKIENKLSLFIKFFTNRLINNYISPISKIYAKYGLTDLAKIHDQRYVEYLLFLTPSVLNKWLFIAMHLKDVNSYYQLKRNNFKGKFRFV